MCLHEINKICKFVDNNFSSEATTLPSSVVIGLVKVEI